MFDFVQENKRPVQIVLAIVIIPFALWGVDSYRRAASGVDSIAVVNGDKISQQEFDNALKQQQQRFREMAGGNFDPSLFDKPEIKQSVLDGLVTQHLLGTEARRIGLSMTDEQIAQLIASVSIFQTEGKFDKKRYEEVLAEKGMNRFEFESRVRQDLLARQLTDAYTQNGYASEAIAGNLIRMNEQQRSVAIARLDAGQYVKQVKLAATAVEDYYKQHADEYQLPERANVDYVVLSADSLSSQVVVPEEEIKQYYTEHQSEFGSQEQRQASHILISLSKQASDAEKQAAKSKAEDVLKQVKASPAKFAELAKQYSQDPGSAANGGDLGMFGRGMMVKPFEESVFSLKVGEVSGLVQSDFGYHIIKLTGIKPGKVQPLSEVRGMIQQRLKLQRANDKFAELAEKFNNIVYEQSDSLKPAAELANTAVQHGTWLNKGQVPAGIWTDKALQAVFAEDALKNKRNTSAIEVAPNTLLAARVVEYKPATLRPLSEVSAAIKQKLETRQAAELATQEGQSLLGKLQHGDKITLGWKAAQLISRNKPQKDIESGVVQEVFRADVSKLPAYVGVNTGSGYVVARIESIKDSVDANDEMKRARYAQQVRQLTGEALMVAYLADLKKRADITVKTFASDSGK